MTSVNVTKQLTTVLVTEQSGQTTVVTTQNPNVVVETIGVGPQGPEGPPGNFDLNQTNAVDGSLVYYEQSSGQFKADTVWTTSTITDGGNW